jgi:hypothetical protein
MNKLALLLAFALIQPTTAPAPSGADLKSIERLAIELTTRADAGDKAFVAKLIAGGTDESAAADMIERIKRADVGKTFRRHLETRGAPAWRLNYHDPSHFQVDLKKGADGQWSLARLWVCR